VNNICQVCGGPMQPDGRLCTLGHARSHQTDPLDAVLLDYLASFSDEAETTPPKACCHACLAELDSDATFCPECGTRQIPGKSLYDSVAEARSGWSSLSAPPTPSMTMSGVRQRPGTYQHIRSADNLMPDELYLDDIVPSRKRRP